MDKESLTMQRRTSLALNLYDIGAIKFGAFRLKLHEKDPDAPLSPFYIDLRVLRSEPGVMDLVVWAFQEEIYDRGLRFNLLADVPTAATPIVAILMHNTRVPMISPRKEVKERGTKAKIEGKFEPGQTVLLVDDLVTRADSKLEAIWALEENGLVVKDVLVLVDREQGGKEQLAEAGYNLHAIFKVSDLFDLYLDKGRISQEKYDEVMAYLMAN